MSRKKRINVSFTLDNEKNIFDDLYLLYIFLFLYYKEIIQNLGFWLVNVGS